MKKLRFQIDIEAPVEHVFQTMIGKDTYRLWAAEFNPTSDFEGGWNKGDKIAFVGINKEGKKEGMVAEIAEHIANEFISIRHYGFISNGVEVIEDSAIECWGDALENYYFEEKDGMTTVRVECSTNDEYVDYFNVAWPKALRKLKEICASTI